MNLNPRQRALLQKMSDPKMPMIQRAGMYRALIEAAQQRGAQPNPAWVRGLQQLELRAQMTMTPAQLYHANLQAEQSKHEWHREAERVEQGQFVDSATEQADRTVREITHGMLGQPHGISRKQLTAVREGKAIPREGKQRPRGYRCSLDQGYSWI